jgi:hypothetical protein
MTESVTTESLLVSQVRAEASTQIRLELSEQKVEEYIEALATGAEFPPVVVYCDGSAHWLADGFHRLEAYRRCERMYIEAAVREGGQRDAVLYAVGANAAHGLPRNAGDVKNAIRTMLLDDEWSQWSDRAIAEQVQCHHSKVSRLRKELEATGALRQSDTRTGADGRAIRTGGIAMANSARREEPEPEPEPEPNAEEIAALPAEESPVPPPDPKPAPETRKPEQPAPVPQQPVAQLPPRLDIGAPAPAGEQPSEVQLVMMMRVLERAAELVDGQMDVIPPYSIRPELVEQQARQIINNPAVKMAASMLSLSATLPEE